MLAVGAGNHDLFAHKQTGYAHLDAAMDRLSRDVPYARIVMYLTVKIRTADGKHEQSYVHEIRHKARGGGKDPAGAARLHMERSAVDIDCVWFGHTHRSGIAEKNLMGKYRLAIQLGTYKQHRLDAYGNEHDYPDENFDSDRGVLMWANRRKIEETRTDAGVERLERFAMGVVAKTPAVARRAQRCGSAKGGRHVHRIRSAAKPPVRATGFAITLRRGGFDAHLSAVAVDRIMALLAIGRTVEQIAAEVAEPVWVVAEAVRWSGMILA